METLYIEAAGLECSEERREISGKIVPMGTGEVGHTNLGGVVFEAGAIDVSDVSKIKLLSQHDMKKPVGRMIAAEVRQMVSMQRSSSQDQQAATMHLSKPKKVWYQVYQLVQR